MFHVHITFPNGIQRNFVHETFDSAQAAALECIASAKLIGATDITIHDGDGRCYLHFSAEGLV